MVLAVEARPAGIACPCAFDPAGLALLATILVTPRGNEHLLLSDGCRRIQIAVVSGSLLRGPVELVYRLEDGPAAKMQMQALTQFLTLRRHRAFRRWLHPPEAHAWRWIRQLRVHDALAAGASERQIATVLFGAAEIAEQWKEGSGPLRSSVQRLIRRARATADRGYLKLLP